MAKGHRPKRQRSIRRAARKQLERRLRPKGQYVPPATEDIVGRLDSVSQLWASELTIQAPSDFSLIRDPESVVEHLHQIGRAVSTNRVVVSDLRYIQNFSTDALLCLIALSNNDKFNQGAIIRGTEPFDPVANDKFKDSGIYGQKQFRFSDGKFRMAQGTIHRLNSTAVRGDLARRLIEFATLRIFGEVRSLKGVYTTMIECMNNTFNHAAVQNDEQHLWWATVYCDTERRTAYFNFLDTGVGILESIELKYSDRFKRYVGVKDNSEVLRDVLDGKIGSRTGLGYRGNGLPQIVKRYEMGQLSRLILVTNNVYADLENDEYRILPKPFGGTFFHWEISYDRHNRPSIDH